MDVETETVTTEDVLVLGTDGLWDVVSCTRSLNEIKKGGVSIHLKLLRNYNIMMQVSNEEVAAIVQRGLQVLIRI